MHSTSEFAMSVLSKCVCVCQSCVCACVSACIYICVNMFLCLCLCLSAYQHICVCLYFSHLLYSIPCLSLATKTLTSSHLDIFTISHEHIHVSLWRLQIIQLHNTSEYVYTYSLSGQLSSSFLPWWGKSDKLGASLYLIITLSKRFSKTLICRISGDVSLECILKNGGRMCNTLRKFNVKNG